MDRGKREERVLQPAEYIHLFKDSLRLGEAKVDGFSPFGEPLSSTMVVFVRVMARNRADSYPRNTSKE